MWFLLPIAIIAASVGLYVTRDKGPTAQTSLREDQLLNLATTVMTKSHRMGQSDGCQAGQEVVDLFRHLGPINATKVATMAMSLGGNVAFVNTCLHASQS